MEKRNALLNWKNQACLEIEFEGDAPTMLCQALRERHRHLINRPLPVGYLPDLDHPSGVFVVKTLFAVLIVHRGGVNGGGDRFIL